MRGRSRGRGGGSPSHLRSSTRAIGNRISPYFSPMFSFCRGGGFGSFWVKGKLEGERTTAEPYAFPLEELLTKIRAKAIRKVQP